MSGLTACISAFFPAFSQHRDLALENLALRQQLAIFKRRHPHPSLRPTDRIFWVWLSKIWAGWREALIIVKPETVIAWHRQAFRFYWRWLSRRKSIGRPTLSLDHVIVVNENHLRRILKSYCQYYHRTRTHLALSKDAPEPRAKQPPNLGAVIEIAEVGGLHHRYERRAA
jgi:hypothetical protein